MAMEHGRVPRGMIFWMCSILFNLNQEYLQSAVSTLARMNIKGLVFCLVLTFFQSGETLSCMNFLYVRLGRSKLHVIGLGAHDSVNIGL